jgi:hypothetical protein
MTAWTDRLGEHVHVDVVEPQQVVAGEAPQRALQYVHVHVHVAAAATAAPDGSGCDWGQIDRLVDRWTGPSICTFTYHGQQLVGGESVGGGVGYYGGSMAWCCWSTAWIDFGAARSELCVCV